MEYFDETPAVPEEEIFVEDFYNRHYIRTNESGLIVDGWSDGPLPDRPTEGAVLLTDKGGYQFRLFLDGEENPALFEQEHWIPLYAYEEGAVRARTEEEIAADIASIPEIIPVPTQLDIVEAQVMYTALVTDTLIMEV